MSETGIPITALPEAVSLTEGAVFPLSDGGETSKATKATLRDQLGVNDALALADADVPKEAMFGDWDVRWSGAIGDGDEHYLADAFGSEAAFAAAYPAAHAVWTDWLSRFRSKPAGDNDPNQSDALSWENLTLDWAGIQEALETKPNVRIPVGTYMLSDSLFQRQSGSTVHCYGTLVGTRGMSRGNVVCIGEGDDLEWYGGTIDGTNTLGDNAWTVFQNQITIADAGWETVNANRVIVANITSRNFVWDATYKGGKGMSLQLGLREVIAYGHVIYNCDIGWTVEGKDSVTPISGPDADEPYWARAVSLDNITVIGASLMGCWILNSSGDVNPTSGSVAGTNLVFINCAEGATDTGVINGDRAANVDLQAFIWETNAATPITPIRGVWKYGTKIRVNVDSDEYTHVIDTRHPYGFGAGAGGGGCVGASFEVKAHARSSSAVNPFHVSPGTGGDVSSPVNCEFALSLTGFTATTLHDPGDMSTTNWVQVRNLSGSGSGYSGYGTNMTMPPSGQIIRRIMHLGMVPHASDPSMNGLGNILIATGSDGWDPLAVGLSADYAVMGSGSGYVSLVPRNPQRTATQIGDATDTVNTVNKFTGKQVWDSTNFRPLWTSGSSATSPWRLADGTVAITPA